jgi:hypothetical protein
MDSIGESGVCFGEVGEVLIEEKSSIVGKEFVDEECIF